MSFCWLLILVYFSSLAQGQCHATTDWNCTLPTCPYLACVPNCLPVECRFVSSNPACEAQTPVCVTQCPPDQCETDSCPQCEANCTTGAVPAVCSSSVYTIECDAMQCDWACTIPPCAFPVCRRVIGPVACTSLGVKLVLNAVVLVGVILGATMILSPL